MYRKLCAALLCIGLIMGISATSIYAFTEISVTNNFSTGIVDIELEEYTIENGKEVRWKDDVKEVLPGDDVFKIPRITNFGNDCYVRAKVSFIDTPIGADALYGMSDKWLLGKDGHYYFTDILKTGESVDLFQGLKIPVDLSEDESDSIFKIQIDVDAIQSQNFIPDYKDNNPWGTVEILDCEKEGMYDITTFKKPDNLKFKIAYVGDTGKLVKNEEDFFKNFPVLLPGDVYTDTLEFTNDSDKKVNLYFRTASPEGTELLDKVILKITKNFNGKDSVIYEGELRATDLYENILLATVESGKSGSLTYEISVPSELDNEYTIMEDYVIWVFATDPIEEIDAVKTGDNTFIICRILMLTGCAFVAAGLLLGKYMKERERNA